MRLMPASDYPVTIHPVYKCWTWQGRKDKQGYGRTKTNQLAHHAVYAAEVGPVPPEHELDHRCRFRACVRPSHLEPVTRRVNERRKHWTHRQRSTGMMNRCPAGHDLKYTGLRTHPYGGIVCRECDRAG